MVYKSSTIRRRRRRRTKADVEIIRRAIYEYAELYNPVTCRQTFYGLVVQAIIAKTQNEYNNTICRLMAEMREAGELPWDWVADNTRWMRKPKTYSSFNQMLRYTLETYRRSVWDNQDAYVEIWCESDAVAGTIIDVTRRWDVPLMVSRGFASKTFLHSAAENIIEVGKPSWLYYIGDQDPSGIHIDRKIEHELRRFAPDAEIHFERVAVTPDQVREWDLPGSPPKATDKRTKSFGHALAVEVEAIRPDTLREIVDNCVTRHCDQDALHRLMTVENAERATLKSIVAQFTGDDE